MHPHHVFNLEPAGTFRMYPICYQWVSGRYFQPETAMYSRCFCWFPGPLAPSESPCCITKDSIAPSGVVNIVRGTCSGITLICLYTSFPSIRLRYLCLETSHRISSMSGSRDTSLCVFTFCSLLSNTICSVGCPLVVDSFGIINKGIALCPVAVRHLPVSR